MTTPRCSEGAILPAAVSLENDDENVTCKYGRTLLLMLSLRG